MKFLRSLTIFPFWIPKYTLNGKPDGLPSRTGRRRYYDMYLLRNKEFHGRELLFLNMC